MLYYNHKREKKGIKKMNYAKIIETLKRLDTTTNKVIDYYIDSIDCRHVIWWNQTAGITQHFYFNKGGNLDNLIIQSN